MKNTHIYIFLFILITFLFVLFSPLDYINRMNVFVHFWIVLLYGIIILIFYSKNEKRKSRFIIAAVLLPVSAYASFIIYGMGSTSEVQLIHVQNRKWIITIQFHTAFMMGNPMYIISTGYPILGSQLFWTKNSYIKYDVIDPALNKYILPKHIDLKEHEGFVLTEENYLVQMSDKSAHPIKLKK